MQYLIDKRKFFIKQFEVSYEFIVINYSNNVNDAYRDIKD